MTVLSFKFYVLSKKTSLLLSKYGSFKLLSFRASLFSSAIGLALALRF